MKHNIIFRGIFISLLILGVGLPGIARGATTSTLYPSDQIGRFEVSFNGEGEAAVAGQITYTNYSKDPQADFTLTIPGKNVRVYRVVQQYFVTREESYCASYGTNNTCISTRQYPVEDSYFALLQPELTPGSNQSELKITLNQPLASYAKTVLYVSYKAEGYVTAKSLGLFDFKYVTPKFPVVMDIVDVTITADPTLYLLKDGKAQPGYASKAMDAIGSATVSSEGKLTTTALDASFNSYAYEDNAINKSMNNLDPNDTLTITGSYATSSWRLSWLYLALALAGLVAFVAIIVIGERRMKKINQQMKGE